MLNTVKVPKEFEQLFEIAQNYVNKYFKEKQEDPSKGTIEVFGERYILVRAASMSVDFFDTVRNLYRDEGEEQARNVATQLLFDITHSIGRSDARNFQKKMKPNKPIEKLSAGPIHFAHSGWAFVDISPESNPTPDENYYLLYDHPFSFESDAWVKSGKRVDYPVCIMSAGYSSGWCEESFGVTLVASEIMCKAKGDETCRFIMAHPSRIESYIENYFKKEMRIASKVTKYQIPSFFESKKMELALRESENKFKIIFENAGGALFVADIKTGIILDCNSQAEALLGKKKNEIIGMHQSGLHPKGEEEKYIEKFREHVNKRHAIDYEGEAQSADGKRIPVWITAQTVKMKDKNVIIGLFVDMTEQKTLEMNLRKNLDDLERFKKVVVEREGKMIELKQHVNSLSEELGRPKPYDLSFLSK